MPSDDCRGIKALYLGRWVFSDGLCSPPHPRLSIAQLTIVYGNAISLTHWLLSASHYYFLESNWSEQYCFIVTIFMTMSPFFVDNFPILSSTELGKLRGARAARAAGLGAAQLLSGPALTVSCQDEKKHWDSVRGEIHVFLFHQINCKCNVQLCLLWKEIQNNMRVAATLSIDVKGRHH